MKIWHRQFGESISNITYQYLPALRWRNFRLFFGGQLLSMSGTFMTQQLTIPWLVYDLSEVPTLILRIQCRLPVSLAIALLGTL